jgi:hypothetical protein
MKFGAVAHKISKLKGGCNNIVQCCPLNYFTFCYNNSAVIAPTFKSGISCKRKEALAIKCIASMVDIIRTHYCNLSSL